MVLKQCVKFATQIASKDHWYLDNWMRLILRPISLLYNCLYLNLIFLDMSSLRRVYAGDRCRQANCAKSVWSAWIKQENLMHSLHRCQSQHSTQQKLLNSASLQVYLNPDIIYTTLCKMQQIYYIHNVVQMQLISYIHNVVQFATDLLYTQQIKQRCAYATNILYTQRCVVCNKFIIYTTLCKCN